MSIFSLSWHRIKAIIIKHIWQFRNNSDHSINTFFWPTLDIILWSFTGTWIASSQMGGENVGLALIVTATFWQLLLRPNYDISLSLIDELRSHNFINLFASPLKVIEWIIGTMIFAFLLLIPLVIYCFTLIHFIFGFNILTWGLTLLPILLLCMLSGFILGFSSSSVTIYRGIRFESFVYMLGWLFALISGIYYPLNIFPWWLQKIAWAVPMSYTFELIRQYIFTNTFDYQLFTTSLLLNLIYLTIALIMFKIMFEKSKAKGLARLAD